MSELHYATAIELAAKIKAREISAVELLDHFLDRVEKCLWMNSRVCESRVQG